MQLKRLLDHFDAYENLHIEIDCIRDQLIDVGVQDEIRFHFVDIDSTILRGLIYRYTKQNSVYGDPVFCSEICIAKNMSYDWQRLVAAKELIHITDTPEETAQSEHAVEALIERLSYPFDVALETKSSTNDKLVILPALAVLVPLQCRRILRELFLSNSVTKIDIAKMAQIPIRYSDIILEEWFDDLIENIKNHNG